MTDWKLIAQARGLDLTDSQLDAHAATLSQLEASLSVWRQRVPPELEPAIFFVPLADPGEGK